MLTAIRTDTCIVVGAPYAVPTIDGASVQPSYQPLSDL